jgi:hypothetical protein
MSERGVAVGIIVELADSNVFLPLLIDGVTAPAMVGEPVARRSQTTLLTVGLPEGRVDGAACSKCRV